jgi:hypothetical protein
MRERPPCSVLSALALTFALLAALPLGGCQPPSPAATSTDAGAPPPSPPSQAAADATPPLAAPDAAPPPDASAPRLPASEAFAAASALPAETLLVITGDGVRPFMERLGHAQIQGQSSHKAAYTTLVRRVTQVFGYNLIDPDFLANIGVDVSSPFGVALLDLAAPAVVSFARVQEPPRFEQALQQLAPTLDLPQTLPNGARAWLPKPDPSGAPSDPSLPPPLAVVLRDGFAFIILSDTSASTRAWAERVAELEPSAALSADPGFQAAVKQLRGGRDGAAILRFASLGDSLERARSAAAARLLSAPDVTPEEVAAEAARHTLITSLYQGLTFAAVGLEVEDKALRLSVQLHATADAPLQKLLRNGDGFPALQRALTSSPLLMLAGQAQPADVLRYLSLAATSLSLSLDDLRAVLKAYAATDLDADFLPTLTGDAGVALTGDLDALLSSLDLSEALDALHLTLTLGVRDPAPFTKALDYLADQPATGLVVKRSPASVYTLPIPHWKTLHIRVTPHLLALSTDPDLLSRLDASPDPAQRGFSELITHPALRALLTRQDAALIALLDHRWIGGLLLLGFRELSSPLPPPPPDATDDYRRAWEALSAVEAQLRPLLDKKYREIERAALGRLKPLGSLALHLRLSPGLIQFDGGLFFDADDLPTIADALLSMAWQYVQKLRGGIDPDDAKLRKLLTQHRKLSSDLAALRPTP